VDRRFVRRSGIARPNAIRRIPAVVGAHQRRLLVGRQPLGLGHRIPEAPAMIAQLGIAFFGVLAVWLVQEDRIERRRWAPVCGLLGQPFWIWMAVSGQQWGV